MYVIITTTLLSIKRHSENGKYTKNSVTQSQKYLYNTFCIDHTN